MAYDHSIKVYRDLKSVIDTAVQEAQIKAEEKGMEKGMEKGKAEGKIEVVLNALKINLPIEQIQTLTGLTQTEITEILSENNQA
jgi:predicted transposase/invertase (TIGR01784 family)